ncbi:MAG: hypothetical protein AAF441_28405 [Pseudomonadota bacterium]
MAGEIVDYLVISKNSPRQLGDAVRRAMQKGWQPQGGVAVSVAVHLGPQHDKFCQALVKFQQAQN